MVASYILLHNNKKEKPVTTNDLPSPAVTTIPNNSPTTKENQQGTQITTDDMNSPYIARILINGETKYGYIDNTGNFIIPPIYAYADEFSEGYAVVYDNNVYRIIDVDGNTIYQSEAYISSFSNGYAILSKQDKSDPYKTTYGYIDTTGVIKIEPKYWLATSFYNDKALVATEDQNYHIIDKNGTILKDLDFTSKTYSQKYENYILFKDPSYTFFGVATIDGDILYDANFQEIRYLGNDIFAMKEPNEDYSYATSMLQPEAIFDKDGHQLTPYNLYDLGEFQEGYASVTDNKYTYFIDTKGVEAPHLPKLEGRGIMKIMQNLIKADIDGQLIYMKMDGTVIWDSKAPQQLTKDVSIITNKLKPSKYVTVYYPSVKGLTEQSLQDNINTKLYDIFTSHRVNLTEEDMISVEDSFHVQMMNDLLIIQRIGYDYYFGAAHGMPIKEFYYINIKSGDFYEFQDLVKEDGDYINAFSEIIRKEIERKSKEDEYYFFPDGFQEIDISTKFYITENSLVIYFYPYDIAPYASGFPEFIIPFDTILDYLYTDGDFWRSFQKQ